MSPENSRKGVGEEVGKKARTGIRYGVTSLFGLFGRRPKSRLNDLDAVHEALRKFSIGTAPRGGGANIGELPERTQVGFWDYQEASLEALFDEVFWPRVMEDKDSADVSTAMAQWKALDKAGTASYWKGRNEDFHLIHQGPGAHKTVKRLFPFVAFGIYDKAAMPSAADIPEITTIVKMFVDGWIAFLDEKTEFE